MDEDIDVADESGEREDPLHRAESTIRAIGEALEWSGDMAPEEWPRLVALARDLRREVDGYVANGFPPPPPDRDALGEAAWKVFNSDIAWGLADERLKECYRREAEAVYEAIRNSAACPETVAEENVRLRRALAALFVRVEYHDDEGPLGEGWQSDGLIKDIAEARKLLGGAS